MSPAVKNPAELCEQPEARLVPGFVTVPEKPGAQMVQEVMDEDCA